MEKHGFISVVAIMLFVPAIYGATITVDDDGPADFNTIQAAISDPCTVDGNEIEVAPGTYHEAINFLGKAIRLYSSGGPGVTTIDANGAYHVVQCTSGEDANTILEGFTITGGNARGASHPDYHGGGMVNISSSPTVSNCRFTENSSEHWGGGMYNDTGSHTIVSNCTFSGNISDIGGGGIGNFDSSPTVTNCTFSDNNSPDGGGMYNDGDSNPTVTNCTFSGNTAGDGGGGMYNDYFSSPTVTNCTFSGNTAGDGGGMYNDYYSNATVTNCILWGDTPDEIVDDQSASIVNYSDVEGGWPGAGANNIDADPCFVNPGGGDFRLLSDSPCVDSGNTSAVPADTTDLDGDGDITEPIPFDLDGGARVVDGNDDGTAVVDMGAFELPGVHNITRDKWYKTIQAAISDPCTVDGNEIEVAPGTYHEAINFLGKAIRLYSSGGPGVTIIDGTGNYHVVQCVSGEDANTILEGFTITGGDANGLYPNDRGGGMYCDSSSPTVTNCNFTGNWADYAGGGMYCNSSPTVANCTFNNNRAVEGGGGMWNDYGSSPTVTNCIFSGNSAYYGGGGMLNSGSIAMVTNCTFTGNSAEHGGAMFNSDGSIVTVTNCILWSDTPDEIYDSATSTATVSYSDVEGGRHGTANIDADPLFALSGDVHLLFGSPCIDAGDPTYTPDPNDTDPDGTERVLDGDEDGTPTVDMGAYEYNPSPLAPPRIAVWPLEFAFIAHGGQAPEPELLEIRSVGGGTVNWLIDADCSWLELNRTGGQSSGEIDNVILDPNISERGPGEYHCTLTITDPNAINSPRIIPVLLNVGCVREVPGTYSTIQSAIDASGDGDIVLVADGTYSGPGNYDLDFGGRAIVVRSENGPENCIINCNKLGQGFYFHSRETRDSILDGFTIELGSGKDIGYGAAMGGAILIEAASPTIRNCVFSSCEADLGGAIRAKYYYGIVTDCNFTSNSAVYGGAMRNVSSSPTVTNCAFTGNDANVAGGMDNAGGSPTVTNCTFTDNEATEDDGKGGAMRNAGNVTVINCSFVANSARLGGGMCNISGSPTVAYCTFNGNIADVAGGGMGNTDSSPTVTNCTFSGNTANNVGGGMYNDSSSPTVTNCTFSGNDANVAGGMYNDSSSPTVTNCTFSGNTANNVGGGIFNSGGSPTVTNCILWGNTATFNPQITGSASVNYSCIQDTDPEDATVYPGTDNIDDDPFFVDADTNDLRLQVMSPCIDIGKNMAGIYCDVRGSVRPIDVSPEGDNLYNNNFDMGAYEFSRYYSGTEDGNVPAFRDVEMPSFCLVGERAPIRWKNHAGFPDDDLRITDPAVYQVNLVLVSEDRTREITLNREPITVPSTTITPDIPYSHEYTFRQIHAGRWHLRVELSEDRNQYVESAQTFDIGVRQPTLFEIGCEIAPPFDADLTVRPTIEEVSEDYFFWSEYAGKLYATGPTAAIVEWTDTKGDPLPVLVGNVWPDEIQIHVADSPAVELLAAGSPFESVKVSYAENDAALNGSQFSATSEGRCVLMYSDSEPYELVPEFEVVKSVMWTNSEHLREAEWPIGTEVNEPDHDANCGGGHIYHQVSPYDADIYDRDARSGQIFAVNLDDPCSKTDDLVVFWYEEGIYGADWPYLPMRYDPNWPTPDFDPNWPTRAPLEKIVIASCLGSEVYDQNSLDATYRNAEIYNQSDPALAGYNPNDEHAAFFYSNLGYPYQAVFALRNDLNRTEWDEPDDYTSEPYVLLKYQDIYDTWYYRVFKVLVEDPTYVLRYAAEAGQLMEPPYPLVNLLPGCHADSNADPGPWWTDYNSRIWARRATDMEPGTIRWFYPLVTGFYYDLDNDGVQDEPPGACVPWLSYHTDPNEPNDPNKPIAVAYDVNWPSDIPDMNVGQTLMKPTGGLPDIMHQCSVEIIYDEPNEDSNTLPAVRLIEPLSEYRVECDIDHLGSIGVRNEAGMLVFDDLPFHLRTRFYYDPLNEQLAFKGHFDDTVVGEPILLLNVITERERKQICRIPHATDDFRKDVNELYLTTQEELDKNQKKLLGGTKALSAGDANGVGYVTLVFADDANCSPLPISVEVIRVVCGPYRGEIKVIESDNVFDERITFKHSGDFGGRPEGRTFEWAYSESLAKPSEPDPNLEFPQGSWYYWPELDPPDGNAATDITVEGTGTGLWALKDLWFSCRYYDKLCDEWSSWTEPQLHESWIKRVMRQVNLFDQRYKDFHETEINTLLSMISQIGERYEGDVALNADPENMNQMGMLALYETLFRRAAEFSIDAAEPINNVNANRTLLFATSRIAALYMLLGNEAYADVLDPTIGFTTEGLDYGMMAPTIHCFQNQTDSLLSEELVLLRGVESYPYPPPLYNRLVWNFTSGDGEVAYASNYIITDMDMDGDIDEYDARILYPQGHGDAWGHYLMALKTYYRLLTHPDYVWVPQPEYVLVAGTPVEVDYFDERQFARMAAAKAKAGAEIVDLTYRQEFDEDPENQWQGYKDSDPNRAWGVDGWASRAGQGAYFDWVVANALLPHTDPNENHTGVQKVDRSTVVEIRDITDSFNEIQAKLDMADIGLNPLGVAKDAIPFDINPWELVDAWGQPSGRTHFEQIYDRAMQALNNTLVAFNFANLSTHLLSRQQDSLEDFMYNVAHRELDYKSRLIEIYGYPYSDDIGP
ncbi:MAG: right-handed parallel beta-helix repeat-containing protein, partial [Planctomycetota bacterium]